MHCSETQASPSPTLKLGLTNAGEVYVLNDGGETDLDLGNYERYLDVSLGKDNNVTTGKVYQYVIEREVGRCAEEDRCWF